MPVVDAVVEDRDLDSLTARRKARPPEARRIDGGNAAVERGSKADGLVDLADPAQPVEALDGALRYDDGERVEDDPVAPADLRARNERANALLDRLLLHGDPGQLPEARAGVELETAPAAAQRLGKPGLGELDDDLRERLRFGRFRARRCQRGQCHEQTDPYKEQPLQIVNGTSSGRESWQ
jgi:hypothetical protein